MVESLLEIFAKRKSHPFYKPTDAHSATNVLGESISLKSMWNTMNRLRKYDFSCGYIFLVGMH